MNKTNSGSMAAKGVLEVQGGKKC